MNLLPSLATKTKRLITRLLEAGGREEGKGDSSQLLKRHRSALEWGMKVIVQALLGGERDGNSPQIPKGVLGLEDVTKAWFSKCLSQIQMSGAKSGEKFAAFEPSLAAVHYRGAWLDDGRETVAGSSPGTYQRIVEKFGLAEKEEEAGEGAMDTSLFVFHSHLLSTYQEVYGRPLTFNDRLFPQVGREAEPTVWALRFQSEEGDEALYRETVTHGGVNIGMISLSRSLLESLVLFGGEDVRKEIYAQLCEEVPSDVLPPGLNTEAGKNTFLWLRRNGVLLHLDENVERTWVHVLAKKDSFRRWRTLLGALRFLKAGDVANVGAEVESWGGWSGPERRALRAALVFLQGVCLYEPIAPGGIATLIVPSRSLPRGLHHGAITVGSAQWENVLPWVDELMPTLARVLATIIPDETDLDTTNPDVGLGHVFRRDEERQLIGKIQEEGFYETTSENVLASALLLGLSLSDVSHEQQALEFQVLIAGAEALGSVRELHTFSDDDRNFFLNLTPEKQALLVRAHYSHFQEPGVALFLESRQRVHPRIILLSAYDQGDEQRMSLARSLRGEPTRHERALESTRSIQNAVMIRAGRGGMSGANGRVLVYWDGRVKLMWSSGRAAWYWGEDDDNWLQENALYDLLFSLNRNSEGALKEREVRLLSDALLWVADKPGLGCMLVIMAKEGALSDCRISLNPKRWKWLEKLGPPGYEPSLLRNVLIPDGGVVLELPQGTLEGQLQLVPLDDKRIFDVGREMSEHPEAWTYGTRHASALGLSEVFSGQCVAITISADGPVTVFWKGGKIRPADVEEVSVGFGTVALERAS